MKSNNTKKLVAITIIAIFAFSIYSGYDATYHPMIVPSQGGNFFNSGLSLTNPYSQGRLVLYNATPFGNLVKIDFAGDILNGGNSTGYSNHLHLFGIFFIGIGIEKLHVPFTAATIVIDSLTIATNGTVFSNFTGSYNRHNIISEFNTSHQFDFSCKPKNVFMYSLCNGPNLSYIYGLDMHTGNFTYWANLTVTPFLFIGPDYFPTNPITLTMIFKQSYPYPKWMHT